MPDTTLSQRQTRSNSTPSTHPSLSDINSLIEAILTEKLGSPEKKMDTMTDSLRLIMARMEEIEGKYKEMERRCNKLEEHQVNIFSEIEDRDRRKNNLVISGLPEKDDGNASERKKWDQEKTKEFFEDLAELDEDDFIKTFRIGKTDSKKPRLLKVICRNEEVKRDLLMKAKDLRSMPSYEGVYVNPDQTPLQQRQSKALREEK